VSVMMSLDTPDAHAIKNFQAQIETFEKDYGFAPKQERSPLFEALWACH
jgi:hypothetical protein